MVSQVEGDFHKYSYTLYIYNLRENQYVGFLKLSEILGLKPQHGLKIAAMDFELSSDGKQLTVLAEDQVYQLSEKHSKWKMTHHSQFQTVMHSSLQLISEIAIVDNQFIVDVPQPKATPS